MRTVLVLFVLTAVAAPPVKADVLIETTEAVTRKCDNGEQDCPEPTDVATTEYVTPLGHSTSTPPAPLTEEMTPTSMSTAGTTFTPSATHSTLTSPIPTAVPSTQPTPSTIESTSTSRIPTDEPSTLSPPTLTPFIQPLTPTTETTLASPTSITSASTETPQTPLPPIFYPTAVTLKPIFDSRSSESSSEEQQPTKKPSGGHHHNHHHGKHRRNKKGRFSGRRGVDSNEMGHGRRRG